MANNFYIYFFGLICHIGDGDNKKYAAIVLDEHHTPRVSLYEGGERNPYPVEDAAIIRFKLDGVVVLPSEAQTTYDFHRFVPSLKQLMGGSPRKDIENAAIRVFYPPSGNDESELTVAALYRKQGIHMQGAIRKWGPDCVARLTELTVTTPARELQVVKVTRKGVEENVGKPLGKNSCVVIENFPHVNDPGHVMKFGKILAGEVSQLSVLQPFKCTHDLENEPKCKWVRDWLDGPAATDLECGNTQWP